MSTLPRDILNLSHFSLTGPKDAASIIPAASLVAGFQDPDFFFAHADRVVFRTPKSGSTTANSKKPRSELREQIQPPSNERNWSMKGNHGMDGMCAVVAAPKDDRVFIAQIHGKRWNHPLLKLWYRAKDSKLGLDVKTGPNGSDIKNEFGKLKLKKIFDYSIAIEDGFLSVLALGKNLTFDLVTLGFSQSDADWYFKAGCYGKSAIVEYYKLEANHW